MKPGMLHVIDREVELLSSVIVRDVEIVDVRDAEAFAGFDEARHRHLKMSGIDFVEKYKSGAFDDVEVDSVTAWERLASKLPGYPRTSPSRFQHYGGAQNLGGKAKEAVGKVTGDKSTENEGKGDQAKSNLKEVGEKVKDAFK